MKTKPFLLATAGSTVDGRTIDENDIDQMASSYDPKTYGARLNIEHIRGLGTEGPFRAYGDVLELSTGEVDVNFNGQTEKRKALFGAFDVTDDAKKLNDAGQKLYPSIEIQPNFAGKGFPYLMGVALTDSPASIATEKLKFNRSLPDALTVSLDEAALLEFADAGTESGKSGESLMQRFSAMLDDKLGKLGGGKPEEKPAAKKSHEEPAAFNITDLAPMLTELGQLCADEIGKLDARYREEIDQLSVKLTKIDKTIETTPAHEFKARPAATGKADELTDC
ncbi:GPO family capsid scaffolding protein [Citromicrobium bathyomarinum]